MEMNQLKIISQNGKFVTDSREVAEMVGREHNALMKTIRVYIRYLTKGDFTLSEFFIESTYQDSTGRKLPHFYITKKGCEMVANKMTGEKGVLFTATYVTKFEEMENQLIQGVPSYMIDNPVQRAEKWIEEQKERQSLLVSNDKKDQIIGELKPKADYVDSILKNKGLVAINQVAKDYGMSAQEMNKVLHKLGVQYKQGKQWLLYRKYDKDGYVHSETIPITRSDGRLDVTMNTKWTQKGRVFIYKLLKSQQGVIPLIEREENPTG
jgi:Rha family phage regulatory protein